MAAPRWVPTEEQMAVVDDPALSTLAATRKIGVCRETVLRVRRERGWKPGDVLSPSPAGPLGTAGIVRSDDGDVTVTSPPIRGGLAHVVDAETYLRDRWDLPTDQWGIKPILVNEWEANAGDGAVMTLGQVKGTFYSLAGIADVLPAPAVWTGPRFIPPRSRTVDDSYQIIVVGDSQAPYHDEALHTATCEVISAIQPARIVHIGDLCDYTNISKHPDHAVIKAEVDECTQAGVDILIDMREAALAARFDILAGNHDIRVLSELLLRAERMAGIHCASLPGDDEPRRKLIDLRELWRLDELGISYVEDERGWMHGELDLIPGPRGLAAVHGNLTGKNVALNTLESVGRSVICGHTHRAESIYQWNSTIGFEMRAMVIGAQCSVRGAKGFPTFVARDKWLQGGALVTVHSDREWTMERLRWNGESLFVGRDRYTPGK